MRVVKTLATFVVLLVGCAALRNSPPEKPAEPCASPGASCAPPEARATGPRRPCPDEMVLVASRFCIDRYEATMVENLSGEAFSPFYPPDLEEMRKAVIGQPWGLAVLGKASMRPPVPPLPDWQRSPTVRARAVSRSGVVPQGYLSKPTAR